MPEPLTRAALIDAMARDEWAWDLAPDVTAVAYIERAERTLAVVLPLIADAIEARAATGRVGLADVRDDVLRETADLIRSLMGADDG